MENYTTIQEEGRAEFKDRGSKFLAYAFPMEDVEVFKKRLNLLKKDHPKAVHFCFAYRIGIDGNNFRSSDDGEPSGSGGKPILGQIHSKELTNVGVIVVRYFGGTLLGVPGLINAYKTSAALALQVVPSVSKPILCNYLLHFDYTRMNDVMHLLKAVNAEIISNEMQLFCDLRAGIPKVLEPEFVHKVGDLQGVDCKRIM